MPGVFLDRTCDLLTLENDVKNNFESCWLKEQDNRDFLFGVMRGSKSKVIDEKEVEEVLSLLEASTLTKEILEQTRLGRDINHVRKTVQSPSIRKRARNLVKSWQELLVPQGSPQVANGQHPRISPGLSPALSKSGTPNKFVPSPALVHSRSQGSKVTNVKSPAAQASRHPLASSKASSQETTKCRPGKRVKSPASNHTQGAHSINVNEGSNLSWPGTPPSNLSESSQDRLLSEHVQDPQTSTRTKNGRASGSKRNFNFDQKQTNHSISESSKSGNRVSDQKDLSKTNVANRKRTRQSMAREEANNSFSELSDSKHPRLIQNPSLSTPVSSKNDVINGSSVRSSSSKVNSLSLDISASDKMVPPVAKTSIQDQTDPFSQSNQRIALLRQESCDSRISATSSDSRKLGRVKTTEQIIEDMQKRSALPVGNHVIAQIRTNQIKKESDAHKEVVPTGAKKRGRKKKNQNLDLLNAENASGNRLAQTKNEYIERFLQTSVAPTPGEDYEPPIPASRQESLEDQPIALGACSSNFSQPSYDNGFTSYSGRQDKPDSGPSASPPEAREISVASGHLPSSSYAPPDVNAPPSERLSETQILSQLPPVDFDNIDWTSGDYQPPQPAPATGDLLTRLHTENMEGVNGTYDRDGQFKSWAEMLTTDSVYDEPLFILPYVMPN